MAPELLVHLRDWKGDEVPPKGGEAVELSPAQAPWLEQNLMGLAE